jgi:probable HAF family extracellular repeat protein
VHGTFAFSINSERSMVGLFVDAGGTPHGFLFRDGSFTTIDDPSAVRGTQARSINEQGDIVSFYTDGSGTPHGFILSRDN